MDLTDKIFDHFLRDFDVSDNAVTQWTNGLNIAGGFAHHQLGIFADGLHAPNTVDGFNRDHRRLIEHDAAPANVNDGVRCPKVNRHVLRHKLNALL